MKIPLIVTSSPTFLEVVGASGCGLVGLFPSSIALTVSANSTGYIYFELANGYNANKEYLQNYLR